MGLAVLVFVGAARKSGPICRLFMGGGDMIDDVETDRSTYALPPHRFEAGTPPIAETIGLGAAIDFVQSIGMDTLRDHEMDLLRYGHQRLAAVDGLTIYRSGSGQIRGDFLYP